VQHRDDLSTVAITPDEVDELIEWLQKLKQSQQEQEVVEIDDEPLNDCEVPDNVFGE
jgi:hypothetical protein